MKNFRLLSPLLALVLVLGAFTTPAAALEDPSLTATSAILVDVTYGTEVLYERAAHERVYPTGLTKVMTALLAVEAVERGNTVLVALPGCLDENGAISNLSATEQRQVTLGRNDDNYIEIVDGLEEGDIVLALSPQGSSIMSAMGME